MDYENLQMEIIPLPLINLIPVSNGVPGQQGAAGRN